MTSHAREEDKKSRVFCVDDGEYLHAFVARTHGEAKSMYLQSEFGCDGWTEYTDLRCSLSKNPDAKGLSLGYQSDGVELLERGHFDLWFGECPKCNSEEVTIEKHEDGIISCHECWEDRA